MTAHLKNGQFTSGDEWPFHQNIERDAGMDWEQVRRNGGPPCFHREKDGTLCGRAKRWEGHDVMHKYVSLENFINSAAMRKFIAAAKTACETSCDKCGDKRCKALTRLQKALKGFIDSRGNPVL